ncbi:MAG TPA: hypothetical protein VF929_09495 [Gemmatimonadaceae bacterium]
MNGTTDFQHLSEAESEAIAAGEGIPIFTIIVGAAVNEIIHYWADFTKGVAEGWGTTR